MFIILSLACFVYFSEAKLAHTLYVLNSVLMVIVPRLFLFSLSLSLSLTHTHSCSQRSFASRGKSDAHTHTHVQLTVCTAITYVMMFVSTSLMRTFSVVPRVSAM